MIRHLEMILGHNFLWACRMEHEPSNLHKILSCTRLCHLYCLPTWTKKVRSGVTSLGRQSDTVHTSLLYRGLAAVLTQPLLTWLTHLDVNCSLVALTGLWDLQCDMDLPLRDTPLTIGVCQGHCSTVCFGVVLCAQPCFATPVCPVYFVSPLICMLCIPSGSVTWINQGCGGNTWNFHDPLPLSYVQVCICVAVRDNCWLLHTRKKNDLSLRNDFRPWFFVGMQNETWNFKVMIRFLIHTLKLVMALKFSHRFACGSHAFAMFAAHFMWVCVIKAM